MSLREYLTKTKTVHSNLTTRYKEEKTPKLKTKV
jgi:hypothetical protein